jgi:hypothetical protein
MDIWTIPTSIIAKLRKYIPIVKSCKLLTKWYNRTCKIN